ncbi:MAG: hypothetical protein WA880_16835, partial [Ornithinimicrobium sp.]
MLYAVLSVFAVWTIGTAGSDIGLAVVLIVPLMITAGVWGRLDGSAIPRRELVTTWVAVAAIVARPGSGGRAAHPRPDLARLRCPR